MFTFAYFSTAVFSVIGVLTFTVMDSNWINEDAQCIHYGSEKFDFGISNCTRSHKLGGRMSAMEGVSGASK